MFWAGGRIASALEKVGSVYLHIEFRNDAYNFSEQLNGTVLSTAAARSDVGQGL